MHRSSSLRLSAVVVTAAAAAVLVGGAPAWADPTPPAAAPPVVDIAVLRTIDTPTDVFPVSPTRPTDADISLENLGTAAQDASFSLTVPTGWTVRLAFPPTSDETCGQTGAVYTCTITAIAPGSARSTQLDVTAAASTPVGSVTRVDVVGGPVGAVDQNPTNNATQFEFRDVGTSVVTPSVAQSAVTVTPGGTVDFAVTLTNAGPDRTSGQSAFVHVVTQTANAVTQLQPTGPGSIEEGGDADAPLAGPSDVWTIDLDPGQSATLHLSWRGNVLGASAVLEVRSSHDPSNSPGTDIVETARSQPVTVAVAATPTAPTAPTAPPQLAATGVGHPVRDGLLGAGAVILGSLVLGASRRRRRA